jgi:hypothetical protein
MDDPFDIESEYTQDVFDQHGYEYGTTPIDTMMANEAMGFDMAAAMSGDGGGGC